MRAIFLVLAPESFGMAVSSGRPSLVSTSSVRRGQSLVVWAIREGRQAARAVDAFLMGTSDLPR